MSSDFIDGAPAVADSLGAMALQAVVGEKVSEHELLDIICQRIREAAKHLKLSREDLFEVFRPYVLFEEEVPVMVEGKSERCLLVEAHHLIQGKVGKGALKIIIPRDLARESRNFVESIPRVAEVIPPAPQTRWNSRDEAWETVKRFLRELITGETLSMSLKSQTTGTAFTGSEGVILCAATEYDEAAGRFFLKPILQGTAAGEAFDKELLEAVMNATAALLTRKGKIAHDRIVHAAETNSTLTARLGLQLPGNVVEGHLRALLSDDARVVIGDEDMTARLRQILARPDYRPTACALAREAARMQLGHSILMLPTRERLRNLLAALPPEGFPRTEQFQEIVGIFFGSGETQQTEDQIFHHRERILKSLATALAAGRLDECDDPSVLSLFVRILLDNEAKLMKAALLRRIPSYEPLPLAWVQDYPLLSDAQRAELEALAVVPSGNGHVKRGFARIVEMLSALMDPLPVGEEERYPAARKEILAQAVQAILSSNGIIPCVERIRYFLTPYTYESVTPKLGVVTRKPLDICGSELRPEAMAQGAVLAMEEFFRSRGALRHKPLDGLTVAIQGLGNAGKGVARLLRERGARLVGASDSRGAIIALAGLEERVVTAIIEHKSAGRRLDTFGGSEASRADAAAAGWYSLHQNPETMLTMKADILVLTAKPAAIDRSNAASLQCKVICELTGAAVTNEAREILHQRAIAVIPDNLGSSGGLLVSLSEMLQNSFGQQWERRLEVATLRQQIEQSYDAMQKIARKHGVDIATASDILALGRMHALAVYRRNLAAAARQLKEHIEAIGDGETVLIVSDDDDDGVSSAAIVRGLIARLNPGREKQSLYVNESLRSRAILDIMESLDKPGSAVKRAFVLDRSFPLTESGQETTAELARRCRLILINNHDLPEGLASGEARGAARARGSQLKSPAAMGVPLISPQTLKATIPTRHFTTALVLREIAHKLLTEVSALMRIDWQAAIGSCLDVAPESCPEWQLFYAQFNPDDMLEAARAVRMVAQAHGFMSAIRAVEGVDRPDQLETNKPWEEFTTRYKLLAERVVLLVEKIVMENVGRPYVSHFFSAAEVASPLAPAGALARCLDLYPWISEHLTRRADFADKPIIVGQVIQDMLKRRTLGVRIRSPRDVELMEVGLPEYFRSGGLPNTAVAKIPLDESLLPEQQFQNVVETIWWKTVSPTIQMKKRRNPGA
jgi:glutamate dehydrogenase/leucine dehydrogenase